MESEDKSFCRQNSSALCIKITRTLLSDNTFYSLLKLWPKPKPNIWKHCNHSFILPKKDWEDQALANHFLELGCHLLWNFLTWALAPVIKIIF